VERTLVLLKPDAIQRGLSGKIISRLEDKGLKLVAMKLIHVDETLASKHYGEHVGKPFYDSLVGFITSSPLIALSVEGKDAVHVVRNLIGATNPVEALPGTIRGDFGLTIGMNLVHGSDSVESAERELEIFFNNSELLDYGRQIDDWIIE
jgi:nucleoside-diphosphate kinase|tara:strand:- start:2076 stop:2525 length:450 start_codon:yes stop_codon:yes gene_type:complete